MEKSLGHARTRKRFVDFQAFLQEVIIPEALRRQKPEVYLIVDNGTTHAPKQLEHWLQQLPVVQEGKLTFQVFWLPPNASWLDQIEIWLSILQRKRLQPNHFASTQELEQAIADFIAYSNHTAKPIKWTYTIEKLEMKLEQRMKQEAEQNSEQKRDHHIKIKPKQKKEQNAKDKLKQKIGQKRENNLRERKRQNVEIRADQNSDRISA